MLQTRIIQGKHLDPSESRGGILRLERKKCRKMSNLKKVGEKKKKKKVGEKTKHVGFLNSYGISYKHFTTKSNILPIPGLRY